MDRPKADQIPWTTKHITKGNRDLEEIAMSCHGDKGGGSAGSKWRTTAIFGFAVFGGYYLWMQHRAHVFQYLPLAFFLLCPLLHLFGGHGGHGKHSHSADDKKGESQ